MKARLPVRGIVLCLGLALVGPLAVLGDRSGPALSPAVAWAADADAPKLLPFSLKGRTGAVRELLLKGVPSRPSLPLRGFFARLAAGQRITCRFYDTGLGPGTQVGLVHGLPDLA